MYLSLRYPIDKLVLLSAAAKYISPRILLEDVGIMLRESITKKYPPNTFYHLYNYKLTHTPLRATFEFLRIVKMVEPYYSKLKRRFVSFKEKRMESYRFPPQNIYIKYLGSSEKKLIKSELENIIFVTVMTAMTGLLKVLEFMQE